MNNPNPFVPQGSVLEQNKRRSRMKLAVFCVLAVSVCGLTAMLIQGCKREQSVETRRQLTQIISRRIPICRRVSTNLPPVRSTNPPPVVPPVAPVSAVVPETAGTEYVVVKGDTLGQNRQEKWRDAQGARSGESERPADQAESRPETHHSGRRRNRSIGNFGHFNRRNRCWRRGNLRRQIRRHADEDCEVRMARLSKRLKPKTICPRPKSKSARS